MPLIRSIAGQERNRVGDAITMEACIWRPCRNGWRWRHERTHGLQACRSLADRRGRPLGSRLSRLCGQAIIVIGADGSGEIAFGALHRRPWTSNTAPRLSSSPGSAPTKWTRLPAKAAPNCSTTARSRSISNMTMATTPFSRRSERVFFTAPAKNRDRPVRARPALFMPLCRMRLGTEVY